MTANSPAMGKDQAGKGPVITVRDDAPCAISQIAGLVYALMLVDPDGRVNQLNHATETLLGTSAKRVLGRPLIELISPVDDRVTRRLSAGDEALIARDVRVRMGGQERPVNLTLSPVSGHAGWRVITVSELGHEKASSEEPDSSTVGAPSILAHEIKNPLSAIRGAAQLIARKLPHGDKKLARMITDEVDRIARLIDRMQQLGSSISDPLAPCNPHEAIRSACATVRAAGLDGVTITEEFDPSIPPVLANRDALEQVLINLISNARDAAGGRNVGEEQGRIIVRTRYVSGLVFSAIRLGRTVKLPIEITITDNGKGVEPSLREKLFEPFVSSKPSGQGLGLALVRKLMRDMSGSISHDRESRAGLTHFRLHLRVAQPEDL